eukprot:scaffold8631_cov108-Isochrysis_galbana.AAC.15
MAVGPGRSALDPGLMTMGGWLLANARTRVLFIARLNRGRAGGACVVRRDYLYQYNANNQQGLSCGGANNNNHM